MKKNNFLIIVAFLVIFNLIMPIQVKAQEGQEFEPKPLDPQLVSCLKEQVGEDIFDSIKSGSRKPSDEEIKKGEICFQKFGVPEFKGPKKLPQKDDFSPQTAACLEKTIGANFTDQMANIKSHQEAEEFKAKTKSCFGMPPPRGEGGQENPEELQKTKDCLIAAVGQAQVDKMFTDEKPEPGSEIFNKIENSGCFKKMNFRPPKDGQKANLSPETEKCLREVLGDNFMKEGDKEPPENKKREAGEKCFGGRGPDGQGQPPNRMSLPVEVESCLKSKVGDRYKEKPDSLSESEKQTMGECFQKNNFRPMGDQGPKSRPEINIDPTTKACIEKITGDIKNQPTEDQKRQLGENCFTSQKPTNPPQGQNQPPENQRPPDGQKPGVNFMPPNQGNDCVKKIVGDLKPPFPNDIQEKINKDCFSGQATPNQPPANKIEQQSPNQVNQPTGQYQPNEQPPPTDDWCQTHPEECRKPKEETEQRFFFYLPKFLNKWLR